MLNERQKKFADYYIQTGNATQAAQLAGYSESTATEQGSRLLTKVKVKEYVKQRSEEASNSRIMTIKELKEFWSSTARGEEDCDYKDRLKASELLGKSEALFTDRVRHEGKLEVLKLDSDEQDL